jgi:hypothetical protein
LQTLILFFKLEGEGVPVKGCESYEKMTEKLEKQIEMKAEGVNEELLWILLRK